MGKHSDPQGRAGNPNQGEGRHVDRDRQPTGRDPRVVDRATEDQFTEEYRSPSDQR